MLPQRFIKTSLRNLRSPIAAALCRNYNSKIDASKLTIERNKNPKAKVPNDQLVFGHSFTDHMLEIDWDVENGWHDPKIVPYGNLSISPAAPTLHYGIGCFEGMKAYKDAAGQVRMFRPNKNIERLENSMARLTLPSMYDCSSALFNDDATALGEDGGFLQCMKELIRLDHDWIPQEEGYSLYIRPTAIGSAESLGLKKSSHCKLFVILSPAGPYYATGFKPVKLLADTKNVRAWPGGVGNVKVAGNYGPTIKPSHDAAEDHDCNGSLWLYGENDEITEVGAMNIFFVMKKKDGSGTEIVTAPLTRGDILPGVTRDSILRLAREWGDYEVSERFLTMGEVLEAEKEGRLLESMGCGTAAIVSPVKSILYKGHEIKMPTGDEVGPVAKKMWATICDIQYGKKDEHPWSTVI